MKCRNYRWPWYKMENEICCNLYKVFWSQRIHGRWSTRIRQINSICTISPGFMTRALSKPSSLQNLRFPDLTRTIEVSKWWSVIHIIKHAKVQSVIVCDLTQQHHVFSLQWKQWVQRAIDKEETYGKKKRTQELRKDYWQENNTYWSEVMQWKDQISKNAPFAIMS